MKQLKIIFMALAAMLTVSCAEKFSTNHEVTFGYAIGPSGSMYTKAFSNTDVLGLIGLSLPDSINISIRQGTKLKATGTTGKGIVLAEGTYSITGEAGGRPVSSEIYQGKRFYLCDTPPVEIKEDVTITADITDYTLTGFYAGCALVCDATVVANAVVATSALGDEEEINFIKSGDICLIFPKGNFNSSYPLTITVNPVDNELYKPTTFNLKYSTGSSNGNIEKGKWYKLVPTYNGQQPKVFELDLPDFIAGGDLTK